MKLSVLFTSISVLFLGACSVAPVDKATSDLFEKKNGNARNLGEKSILRTEDSRVTESNRVFLPVVATANTDISPSAWLSKKRVSLNLTGPLPLNEVIKIFWSQGVNISTTLPVDTYTYGGLGINNTDAESALRLVMSSVGLDYELDNVKKTVLIKPFATRSWYLNIGRRSTSYSSGGGNNNGSQSQVSQTGGLGQGTTSSVSSLGSSGLTGLQSTGSQSFSSNGNSSNTSTNGTSSTGINSGDNFWASLDDELKKRLTILVPNSSDSSRTNNIVPAVPLPAPLNLNQPIPPRTAPIIPSINGGGANGGLYVSRQVGEYSLNPETGAVNVQAPHWILDELEVYMKRVKATYNTSLTFTGELVLLTSDSAQSQGLDISSFGRVANSKYGLAVKNNGLGGITISVPTDPSAPALINSAISPVSSTLIGITGLTNGLQIFNAYLSNHGIVSVLQKPVLSTSSGVPVEFSKIVTQYYNTVTQQASTGNVGGAATATQNTLVPVDLGTVIKINPRFDFSTGLIRAQISLYQSLQSSTQSINQSLTAGSSVTQVPVVIPILTKLNYSGEALLQDGDIIVVGGQQDDTGSDNSDGITGLKDGFLGGIFGNRSNSKTKSTYYFALRVSVDKREGNLADLN